MGITERVEPLVEGDGCRLHETSTESRVGIVSGPATRGSGSIRADFKPLLIVAVVMESQNPPRKLLSIDGELPRKNVELFFHEARHLGQHPGRLPRPGLMHRREQPVNLFPLSAIVGKNPGSARERIITIDAETAQWI